jgi:uncharacterized circularly permuted ATP-grasp superfamily protein/uncharacterized alpha-E superfamily protein
MTVLGRYLEAASRFTTMDPEPAFDEFAAADGTVRQGWSSLLAGLDEFADTDLLKAQREVARLLEDDNVTYTPSPGSTLSIADEPNGHGPPVAARPTGLVEPQPWRLDPLPLILEDREWAGLEAGLVQRAQLLDAIMADLYSARRLLARRHLPAAAIFDHDEYLRPLVDSQAAARQRLFMVAADLGRDASGQWKVISDRTQAPSGAGYAMQNRRVVSQVMPEIYHQANLHRLTPFFQAMRLALVDAAPATVEDPRVVVLSPGTLSETAFDQAFVASLLGFPLLEGSDLTVRDGRVWMRVLGKLEQVDVILRRVDSTWMDALELRPNSRLGVTGLLECLRQGTVSVLNNLGSGALENPALMPYLPELCERLLGQTLRLPSVETWWCGDEASLSHVLHNLDSLVIRPISRGHGRSVRGAALTRQQREMLANKIKTMPHRFVGQEVLHLSSAPTSEHDRLVRRNVVLRSFAVRSGESYAAMLGGLARVTDDASERRGVLVTDPNSQLAKDVWVVGGSEPVTPPRIVAGRRAGEEPGFIPALSASIAMVPRVLSDLYWFGRYAERAEDLLRLLLATRTVAIETDLDFIHGGALEVMLHAVTHVSTTYPGFLGRQPEMFTEFRSLLLDRHRTGTVAQSLAALSLAAQGVRDQLSEDVWIVLADVERALAALSANPYDQGLQLTDISERVLSGLLALAGIATENMVRDPGWYMLDSGRGLERALQVVALLRVTICQEGAADTDGIVLEAVLTAAESIVTFRRRYHTQAIDALLELLVINPFNPRSVAYQLNRIRADLRALPNTSPTARPLRLLDSLAERVRTCDPVALAESENGRRSELHDFLGGLHNQLRALSDAIRDHYQQQPPTQRPLFRPDAVGGAA